MALWSDLVQGRTPKQVLADFLAAIKGRGLPVDDWEEGGVFRTVLQWALAPAVSSLWTALSGIARGGFVRLAQALAEQDLATWNASPQSTWLYLLATQLYQVTPYPAQATQGLQRFRNALGTTYTATPSTVVTVQGVRFGVVATTPIPPGDTWVAVQAQAPGSGGNVPTGLAGTLNVSMPGVTVSTTAPAGAASWITRSGSGTETPRSVGDRCVAQFGTLPRLSALPRSGYVALALDRDVTGVASVAKVAVWSNYKPGVGYAPNAVTVYCGGEAAPISAGDAALVQAALRLWCGLHDTPYAEPCATATWAPGGRCYVAAQALIAPVRAAVELRRQALQRDLQIGGTGYAWQVRACFDVPGVVNFADANADLVPAKNALIAVDFSAITYEVAP